MPGFLGGGGGTTSGTGGEITFPKEFIDPVTKLRISNPENLIDTDFEYGLQPTKWETVELINNTPSFFSKSGDTTIPGIIAITTNAGTREITVTTALDHGLAVGIPINVTGTKSVTADGSYVINSIPNGTTFTYLCRANQPDTSSIEDLYSSIITGEFFQGSQLRISDADGIVTDAEPISTLTVKTESTHGFGVKTPFYFLNLNSTISQEFEAANTAAKSFDSSNSATAQTFDGSNTQSTVNIDWSNSATVGGETSTISSVNTSNETITVAHGAENFDGLLVGQPLYYSVTGASSGFFADNPRGVVFLKTNDTLSTSSSTFQVSAIPDGDAIDIVSNMSGTFQIANQARTIAGNNVNADSEVIITVVEDEAKLFDGANDRYSESLGAAVTNKSGTITNKSAGLLSFEPDSGQPDLDFYPGSMVLYETTGSAATGLTNNTTYWVDDVFLASGISYRLTLKATPDGTAISSITGGTGTETLKAIGVSVDKDVIHVRDNGFATGDMIRYEYPAGGRFDVSSVDEEVNYYFVQDTYDAHNFIVDSALGQEATVTFGGTVTTNEHTEGGVNYISYTIDSVGSGSVQFARGGEIELLVVAGGGGASSGGGGAGGLVYIPNYTVVGGTTYNFSVGDRGTGNSGYNVGGNDGGDSTFSDGSLTIRADGGGGGLGSNERNQGRGNGGSGGGAGSDEDLRGLAQQITSFGPYTNVGFGNNGGVGYNAGWTGGGGGGGAGGAGARPPYSGRSNNAPGGPGGIGRAYNIRTGSQEYYAGGGAGGNNYNRNNTAIAGGLGGGGRSNSGHGTGANGQNAFFYGGGGGGGDHEAVNGSFGYRGVVIFRHTV